MWNDEPMRRDILHTLAALPFVALLAQAGAAAAHLRINDAASRTMLTCSENRIARPLTNRAAC